MNKSKLKQQKVKKQFTTPFFNDPSMRERRGVALKVILKKYERPTKLGLLLVLIIALIYKTITFVFYSETFKLKTISVSGAVRFVNQKDILAIASNNVLKQNYYLVNTSKLESTLEKNFLGAKEIKIYRIFPNKLSINISERKPLCIIYKNLESYLIDIDGYVLGPVQPEDVDLPKIQYEGEVSTGTFVDKNIIPVTQQILKESDKANLKVSSMSFNPNYTHLYVNNSVEVLIGNNKEKKSMIDVIAALVQNSELEGKKLRKIDLRYDKVIVLYD